MSDNTRTCPHCASVFSVAYLTFLDRYFEDIERRPIGIVIECAACGGHLGQWGYCKACNGLTPYISEDPTPQDEAMCSNCARPVTPFDRVRI